MQLEFLIETEKLPVNANKLLVYLLNVAMGRVSRGRIEDVEKDSTKDKKNAIKVCLSIGDLPVKNDHYVVNGNVKCTVQSNSPIYIMELMYGLQSIRLFTHCQYQLNLKEVCITERAENERVQCFVHQG
ncbi:MAG: hypothetical protein ACI35O_05830 [Bacillaceae bacterium]